MNDVMNETAAEATNDVLLAEFSKNSREVVRVRLTEYRGLPLIDIRAFYPQGGEMKPGKGLALNRELIKTLRIALQAAEKAAKDAERTDAAEA